MIIIIFNNFYFYFLIYLSKTHNLLITKVTVTFTRIYTLHIFPRPWDRNKWSFLVGSKELCICWVSWTPELRLGPVLKCRSATFLTWILLCVDTESWLQSSHSTTKSSQSGILSFILSLKGRNTNEWTRSTPRKLSYQHLAPLRRWVRFE